MRFPFIPCTLELDLTGLLRFELPTANQARCLSAITMLMEIPITSQELIIDVDEICFGANVKR